MTLLRTPLYDLSAAAKARFVEFSGWEMAVQYSGLKAEHNAVRDSVGMFDISHMGKFALAGENLVEALQTLVPEAFNHYGIVACCAIRNNRNSL